MERQKNSLLGIVIGYIIRVNETILYLFRDDFSQVWLRNIIVAILGNAAEHLVSVIANLNH